MNKKTTTKGCTSQNTSILEYIYLQCPHFIEISGLLIAISPQGLTDVLFHVGENHCPLRKVKDHELGRW